MEKKFFVLIVISFLAWGCTSMMPQSPQLNPDLQNVFIINANFDEAWTALIETFADLNLPINNMEKGSGLITTDWMATDKTFCDCGSSGLTTATIEIMGKFNVFLKESSESSCEMKVNCLYEKTIYYGMGPKKYSCISTGKLELSMYELIKDKVK